MIKVLLVQTFICFKIYLRMCQTLMRISYSLRKIWHQVFNASRDYII